MSLTGQRSISFTWDGVAYLNSMGNTLTAENYARIIKISWFRDVTVKYSYAFWYNWNSSLLTVTEVCMDETSS